MFRKLAIISVFAIALFGPAHAHWCQGTGAGTHGGTGIVMCDTIPENWQACGEFKDGAPIYSPQCGGGKKHASSHDHTKVVLISAGVGLVFLGAMWYFFKKRPSENNPGQVTLMTF